MCFTLKNYVIIMIVQVLVISNDIYFRDIVGVSDAYVPAVEVWVGSFPYLNKVRYHNFQFVL